MSRNRNYGTPTDISSDDEQEYEFGSPSSRTSTRSSDTPAYTTERDPNEIVIAIMGVTGAGKSKFINTMTGEGVVEGHTLESCTQELKMFHTTHNGKKLVFVDTPGFNDTNKPDSMILEQVARWLDITYRKGKHLAGIIYLHRITDNRMDGTSLRNLRMFKKLCGPDALKNVCLTTTHWDMVDQRKGRSREVELQGKFWQEMIKLGARTARFDGRAEAAWRVVEPMMNNQTVVLQIQDEMGRQHMKLSDTDAGKAVSKELAKAEKKFQEEIAALRKEWQSAVQEKDREVARVLESERRRAEERLTQTQKERDQFIRMQYEDMKRSNEALLQKLERDNRQYGFLESLGMAFSALIPRFRSS